MLQVLVQWVVFHTLVLDLVLEQLLEVSMEPEERVGRSAFLFILLEIGIFLWVSSVIWLQSQRWLRVNGIKLIIVNLRSCGDVLFHDHLLVVLSPLRRDLWNASA